MKWRTTRERGLTLKVCMVKETAETTAGAHTSGVLGQLAGIATAGAK